MPRRVRLDATCVVLVIFVLGAGSVLLATGLILGLVLTEGKGLTAPETSNLVTLDARCLTEFRSCASAGGCETNVMFNRNHCGGCNQQCCAGFACSGGACLRLRDSGIEVSDFA